MKSRIMGDLKKVFRPEFLNRIDEVIVFHKLTKEEIMEIVDLMISRVRAQVAEHELQLDLTKEAKELLVDKGWDPAMGARPLRRAIQRYIEDPLADEVLKAGEMAAGLDRAGRARREGRRGGPAAEAEDRQAAQEARAEEEDEPEKVGVGAGKKGDGDDEDAAGDGDARGSRATARTSPERLVATPALSGQSPFRTARRLRGSARASVVELAYPHDHPRARDREELVIASSDPRRHSSGSQPTSVASTSSSSSSAVDDSAGPSYL